MDKNLNKEKFPYKN